MMAVSDCPSWCVGDHQTLASAAKQVQDGDFSDFVHSTEPAPIPVVTLVRRRNGTAIVGGEIFDVVLFQYQFAGKSSNAELATEEWVFVGSDDTAFTITRESARRLYRLLGSVLSN